MDLERYFKFACVCYFGSSTSNFPFGERKNEQFYAFRQSSEVDAKNTNIQTNQKRLHWAQRKHSSLLPDNKYDKSINREKGEYYLKY